MNNKHIDPICGMQVDEKTAQYKSEYKGKTYYFCASGCKKAFDAEPEKYLKDGNKGMSEKKPWWKFWGGHGDCCGHTNKDEKK